MHTCLSYYTVCKLPLLLVASARTISETTDR